MPPPTDDDVFEPREPVAVEWESVGISRTERFEYRVTLSRVQGALLMRVVRADLRRRVVEVARPVERGVVVWRTAGAHELLLPDEIIPVPDGDLRDSVVASARPFLCVPEVDRALRDLLARLETAAPASAREAEGRDGTP